MNSEKLLEISELFKDFIKELQKYYKLQAIKRFSTSHKINYESVSDHCFFTMLIARLFCSRFKVCNNIQKILDMALIHDISELYLGDMSHDTKVKFNKIEKVLIYHEKNIIKQLLQDDYFVKIFEEYIQQRTIESKIVKLADIISVLVYIENEKRLGNKNLGDIIERYEEVKELFLIIISDKDEK